MKESQSSKLLLTTQWIKNEALTVRDDEKLDTLKLPTGSDACVYRPTLKNKGQAEWAKQFIESDFTQNVICI